MRSAKLYIFPVCLILVCSKTNSTPTPSDIRRVLFGEGGLSHQNNFSIVGSYGCPEMVGNRVHDLLNAAAMAYVSGRRLIVTWSKLMKNQPRHLCEQLLPLKVPFTAQEPNLSKPEICAHYDIKTLTNFKKLFDKDHTIALSCMGSQEAGVMSLPAETKKMEKQMKERVDELFNGGISAAYGALFHALFEFAPGVRIRGPPRGHKIFGFHIRGYYFGGGKGAQKRFRNVLAQAHEIIESYRNNTTQNCTIVVGSESKEFLKLFKTTARGWGCGEIFTIKHSDEKRTGIDEHGSFPGIAAIQDLYLLSLSDVFFGTHMSTFSLLVQELVAFRGGHSYWMYPGIKKTRSRKYFSNPSVTRHTGVKVF